MVIDNLPEGIPSRLGYLGGYFLSMLQRGSSSSTIVSIIVAIPFSPKNLGGNVCQMDACKYPPSDALH
jgi:hypothetical protein